LREGQTECHPTILIATTRTGPLEGKDALKLYIAKIMSNVDELSQQAEFLEQALENMKRLHDELEAIRKMGN
jgi:hypothetical protein